MEEMHRVRHGERDQEVLHLPIFMLLAPGLSEPVLLSFMETVTQAGVIKSGSLVIELSLCTSGVGLKLSTL